MRIHSTTAIRVVTIAAASSLVAASAGFGAVYAYRLGIPHSYLLAGLSILFVVALELAKPIAIASGRLPLIVLGCVASLYSLTAELSLWARLAGVTSPASGLPKRF